MSRRKPRRTLGALIRETDKQAESLHSLGDVLEAADAFRTFGERLPSGNRASIAAIGGSALILLFLFLADGIDPAYRLIAGLATVFIGLSLCRRQSNRVGRLSRKLARRAAFLRYDLSAAPGTPDQLAALDREFKDYRRGNHSRQLQTAVRGVYKGPVHTFAFTHHHLHYVDRRVETVMVPDGRGGMRTRTRTVYRRYDRYSLVIDFPWVKEIAVQSDRRAPVGFAVRSDTALGDFNRLFRLSGQSELTCARFAKPPTVLHLLEFPKVLSRVNLEFSPEGHLCLSFDNDDLLSPAVSVDLHTPHLFRNALENDVLLLRLMQTLALVHTLAEQHDDNFHDADVMPVRQEP